MKRIAHQLIEGEARLRISPDPRSGKAPAVCGGEWS
jgi:hypothetical protein